MRGRLYRRPAQPVKRIANNPVARAMAQRLMRDEILDLKLMAYIMSDGEPCGQFVRRTARILGVAGMAAERQWPKDMPAKATVSFNIIRGGLSTARQAGEKWSTEYAPAIEQGLEHALQLCKVIATEHQYAAWIDCNAIELAADRVEVVSDKA
jgi:hypothetical protein